MESQPQNLENFHKCVKLKKSDYIQNEKINGPTNEKINGPTNEKINGPTNEKINGPQMKR